MTDLAAILDSLESQCGKKGHKLADLRVLSKGMVKFEEMRRQRMTAGHDPAEVDRDTAQLALTCVVGFFVDHGIESGPLVRLLSDIEALSNGSSPSAMLAPAATRHRRADSPTIEEAKGRVAAAMEYLQQSGLSREAAAAKVIGSLSPTLRRNLKSPKPSTVDSWLVRWGGEHGADSGAGRGGYLHMRAILAQQRPSHHGLKKALKALERSLSA